MSVEEYPRWSRAIDVAVGLFLLVVGAWILLFAGIASEFAVFLLLLALGLSGVARVMKGITIDSLSRGNRAMNIVVGTIAIALAMYTFVSPALGAIVLLQLITIGLILLGLVRISMGIREDLPKWARALHLMVGCLTIGLGVIVMLFTAVGFLLLAWLVAASFMADGLAKITNGATGKLR
jgi:uncharacterized membrane protein HdeD (DUF308 family)